MGIYKDQLITNQMNTDFEDLSEFEQDDYSDYFNGDGGYDPSESDGDGSYDYYDEGYGGFSRNEQDIIDSAFDGDAQAYYFWRVSH